MKRTPTVEAEFDSETTTRVVDTHEALIEEVAQLAEKLADVTKQRDQWGTEIRELHRRIRGCVAATEDWREESLRLLFELRDAIAGGKPLSLAGRGG